MAFRETVHVIPAYGLRVPRNCRELTSRFVPAKRHEGDIPVESLAGLMGGLVRMYPDNWGDPPAALMCPWRQFELTANALCGHGNDPAELLGRVGPRIAVRAAGVGAGGARGPVWFRQRCDTGVAPMSHQPHTQALLVARWFWRGCAGMAPPGRESGPT